MSRITLRTVNDEDIGLLTEWLNKDYILKWYHEPNDWLHEINRRNDKFAWVHHFIVMDGKTPVGFCQYYDCFDANDMEDWYDVPRSGETFSIDYLIGNETYLNKGYGKAIVKLLTDTIKQTECARQIIVQPEKENHSSNHVLLANGYIFDEQMNCYCKSLD